MKAIIENNSSTVEDKLLFCLFSAYRVRNNLFHGEKEPKKMWEQNDLFEQTNSLLIKALEAKKKVCNPRCNSLVFQY